MNCDEYYSYNALAGLVKTGDDETTRWDPWELVTESVTRMKRNGDVMRSDRLKQVMQEIDASFDEKNLGMPKFSRFVQEAAHKGLLKVTKLESGQLEIDAPRRRAGSSRRRCHRWRCAPPRRGADAEARERAWSATSVAVVAAVVAVDAIAIVASAADASADASAPTSAPPRRPIPRPPEPDVAARRGGCSALRRAPPNSSRATRIVADDRRVAVAVARSGAREDRGAPRTDRRAEVARHMPPAAFGVTRGRRHRHQRRAAHAQ